jgi:hypothetical protein
MSKIKIILAHDNAATKGNGMDKSSTCHEVWSDMTAESFKDVVLQYLFPNMSSLGLALNHNFPKQRVTNLK